MSILANIFTDLPVEERQPTPQESLNGVLMPIDLSQAYTMVCQVYQGMEATQPPAEVVCRCDRAR